MCLVRRSLLGALCALMLTATGCADGFPSKVEFIAEAKQAIPQSLSDQIADARITPEAGNTLIEQHLGCIYDTIRNDERLVDGFIDDRDSEQFQADLDDSTARCDDRLQQALLEAVTASTK